MFALEKQTRLVQKQTRFILTLPVAGAVYAQKKLGHLPNHYPSNSTITSVDFINCLHFTCTSG